MKYIVFYDSNANSSENRYFVVSCQSKAEYIMAVLGDIGIHTDVISPSLTKSKRGFYGAKSYALNENTTVHLPATMGFSTILGKIARRIWQWWAINCFVWSKIEKNDTVIAYHSVSLCRLLLRLKKRKNITLILHVEEIYSDVSGNKRDRRKENKVFAVADKFIVPTSSINEKINHCNKRFVISHGDYKSVSPVAEKYSDGRIHCVYAGTFDTVKGGAQVAVKCAEYLDSNFCVHIIGFGTAEQRKFISELIENTRKKTACEIVYDGEKRGDDFKNYIQKCHIGLSTQKPGAVYNESSFPSKVLTYMANGLAVVTVKIPVLEQSRVNDFVTYYQGDEPSDVAAAVRKCAESGTGVDYFKVLETLDKEFSKDLLELI